MGPGCLRVSGTVRRGRGDNIGSAARGFLVGRSRAGRDEDSRTSVRHIVGESVELVGEDLFEVVVEGRTSAAKTEQILLKAVVVAVEDCKWGSQCEEVMGNWSD